MTHHAWACKQLIFPVALAFASVTLGNAAPQEASSQPSPQLNFTPAQQLVVKPPQVTYEDGQLTIIAETSSLSDVMRALRAAVGADIELPASVADQRIWVHLGPGPARRVLRDLLDGTEFNYVMQASETDTDGIRSVLLTQRSKPTNAGGSAGTQESAASRTIPRDGSRDDASDSEKLASAEAGAPARTPPVGALVSSTSQPSASNNPQDGSLSPTPTNSAGSSSAGEQMIQQLQSMYQQRRQIQIQQNQKTSQQAPNQ